jgi:D-alanyl-D-alanine carboxypeptidase
MTALLVLEQVADLNEPVTFSAHALDIPSYASRIWMHEGEQITVLEALYGILLSSGNEVARALAEHVSGSVPAFVEEMNARAAQLGALHTHFVNPCGLPGDGQFTTAYDIALIMREATRHPVFLQIINTPYFEIAPTNIYGNPRLLRNTNRMVRPGQPEYHPHVVGGKTGFTNAAQHTLVSYVRQGERRLIISTLYADRGVTFTDTAALIGYAFALLDEREAEQAAEMAAAAALEAAEAEAAAQEVEAMAQTQQMPDEATGPTEASLTEDEGIATREAVVVASVSLLTVVLGLLAVGTYYRRKRRKYRIHSQLYKKIPKRPR